MGDNKAGYQSDNIIPPRDGLVIQLAVGVGALSLDLSTVLVALATQKGSFDLNSRDSVFLNLLSMGGDTYYNFSPTAKVLVPATLGQATLVGFPLAANLAQRVRIDRLNDKFLNYVSKVGTPFLFISPASQVSVGYP